MSRDLDPPLKTQHQELKVWCLANNLREKQKNSVCFNFSIVVITQMNLKNRQKATLYQISMHGNFYVSSFL